MALSFLKKLFGSETKEAGALPPMVDAEPADLDSMHEEEAPAADPKVLEGLKECVRYVATSLVDKPEEVSLDIASKRDLTIIQVHCFKKDIGKIIGKSGKTITALRTLISGAASRHHLRVTVDVMDD